MNAIDPTMRPSRADTVQLVTFGPGLTAWLVEDYAVPVVSLDFGVSGGASQDAAGKSGAASLMSSLLDEGAGDLDDQAFHRAIDDKAIEISFSADRDHFTGRLRTLAKNVDAAFELLRLAVNAPRFDAEPMERVRGQMLASLRREQNDPETQAGKAWRQIAFGDHAYARPVNGAMETLPAITRDDLVALHRNCFTRDTLRVSIVGAIDAARAAQLLDAAFSALPQSGARVAIPEAVVAAAPIRVVDIDVPQSAIRFGLQGVARHDPDFMAAMVVNHILGGGVFSARLFKEVREKRGLAYSVHSSLMTSDHSAMFIGGTSTKNERAAESLAVIEEQIADLTANGPSETELDHAKKYLIGSYPLRFDTSMKIASQLTHLQLEGFAPSYLDERNRLIDAVTLDDARRAAKRLFEGRKLLVAVAGRPVGLG